MLLMPKGGVWARLASHAGAAVVTAELRYQLRSQLRQAPTVEAMRVCCMQLGHRQEGRRGNLYCICTKIGPERLWDDCTMLMVMALLFELGGMPHKYKYCKLKLISATLVNKIT